jgi:hypothetical protein
MQQHIKLVQRRDEGAHRGLGDLRVHGELRTRSEGGHIARALTAPW